ncbi:MAG: putative sugar nucleotidyl transferase [Candidatus Ratteibacteria bacterium]|jgi:UDP-N-acetylglucosamine diphosphorylase/glucosamine-1-phosphate N-acetyltransferase
MKKVVFEDSLCVNMTPIADIRPVFELICGFSPLLKRIEKMISSSADGFWVREYLKDLTSTEYQLPVNDPSFFQEDLLLLNGRWLIKEQKKKLAEEECVAMCGTTVVYAFLKKKTAQNLAGKDFFEILALLPEQVPRKTVNEALISYPWDLVRENVHALEEDFLSSGCKGIEGFLSPQAVIEGSYDHVYIAPEAKIHPFVVIDSNTGPVYVEKNAEIFSGSRIEGPCFLGEKVTVMPGSNIRRGNSIGKECRIGGEIERSIFHPYVNKCHDGFIGHSYLGEFVNLGALSTNSDLKNDYTTVSVLVNGQFVDTKEMKIGVFIGDHTKTGIGTLLNTGTSVGIMCNITANTILPKFFPAFTWYAKEKFMKGFGLEAMISTARIAMERRNRTLTPEMEEVFRSIFAQTKKVRQKYSGKPGFKESIDTNSCGKEIPL